MLRGLERPRRSDSPAARDAEVVEKAVQIAAIAAAAGAPEPPAPPVRKGMGWFPRESLGLQLVPCMARPGSWKCSRTRGCVPRMRTGHWGNGKFRNAAEHIRMHVMMPSANYQKNLFVHMYERTHKLGKKYNLIANSKHISRARSEHFTICEVQGYLY